MATQNEVSQFLREVAGAISLGHVSWISRVETVQSLVDLNITQSIALDLISQLKLENYSSGPTADRNCPGRDVWVFGVDVDGVEVYVKLAMQQHRVKKTVVLVIVWSFHPAKHSLTYPLVANEYK